MTTLLAALAILLAVSAGLNWWAFKARQKHLAEVAALRTELAHVVEAGQAREDRLRRDAEAAAEVRAKTAARLAQEPSAVEVRRTIDRIRRRRR